MKHNVIGNWKIEISDWKLKIRNWKLTSEFFELL